MKKRLLARPTGVLATIPGTSPWAAATFALLLGVTGIVLGELPVRAEDQAWAAASDFIISGNTIKLDNNYGKFGMNIMPGRHVLFAGNQILGANMGIHIGANYIDAANLQYYQDPARYICKLRVMCNDFSGIPSGFGNVIVHQGTFPLLDTLHVYANKMGGSQTVFSDARYQNSLTDPSFSTNAQKSKVAIVGNFYNGSPTVLIATMKGDDPFFSGLHPDRFKHGSDFMGLVLKALEVNGPDLGVYGGGSDTYKFWEVPNSSSTIFGDQGVWALY